MHDLLFWDSVRRRKWHCFTVMSVTDGPLYEDVVTDERLFASFLRLLHKIFTKKNNIIESAFFLLANTDNQVGFTTSYREASSQSVPVETCHEYLKLWLTYKSFMNSIPDLQHQSMPEKNTWTGSTTNPASFRYFCRFFINSF